MSAKRQQRILLKSLDTSVSYMSVGIDLAKNDLSVVALASGLMLYGIDRIGYPAFFEMTAKMEPTCFAMEPCNGYRIYKDTLEAQGHRVRIIGGNFVQAHVNTFLSGQKTDLNDAQALAFLALSEQLIDIRGKTPHEARLLTLSAIRQQFIKQHTATVVAYKGMMQSWGVLINRGTQSIKTFRRRLESQSETIGDTVNKGLQTMIDMIETLAQAIKSIDKEIQNEMAVDERLPQLSEIPFLGPVTLCRLLGTIGDIQRFPRPRMLMAYYGMVPRNKATGHNGRVGKMTKRGDTLARTYLLSAAGCYMMANAQLRIPDCGIKRWLEKKIAGGKHWNLIKVELACKLLRIIWAILKHGERFSLLKAGLSREAIETLKNGETPLENVGREDPDNEDTIIVKDPYLGKAALIG